VRRTGLWTGVLGAPLAWLLTLVLGYALVPWACTRTHPVMLHVVTALGVAAAFAAGVGSWRAWTAVPAWPDDGPGTPRRRFIAGVGLASSVLFGVVILASEIPVLVLGACE